MHRATPVTAKISNQQAILVLLQLAQQQRHYPEQGYRTPDVCLVAAVAIQIGHAYTGNSANGAECVQAYNGLLHRNR